MRRALGFALALLPACSGTGEVSVPVSAHGPAGAPTDATGALDGGVSSDAVFGADRPVPLRPPAGTDAAPSAPTRDAARPGPVDGGVDVAVSIDGPPPSLRDAAPLPPTPDAAAPPPAPLVVAVISDLNGGYGDPTYEAPVHTAVQRIIDVHPDLVLCAGDMVAGQQGGLDYRAMWRGFHAAVSDPLAAAGIPLAVSPGNHDASGYGGFEGERRIYADEWSARRPAVDFTDDADYPFRYAFTVGQALFVALDDTLVGPMGAAGHDWVDARLSDRADLPVKVVFGHVPIRPFTQGREQEILDDGVLEDLLVAQDVTVFISGHHHGYFPGRHAGLRQVGMPCLGSGSRRLVGTNTVSPRGLVFFRIEAGGITELEGYTGGDMTTRIERSSLPASVGVLTRDDL